MGNSASSVRRSGLRPLLNWLPAVLAVIMIALESTATMSAANTSGWLLPIWTHLFGPVAPERWDEIHHLIRKTGHFVGYGVVSVCFFYGWSNTLAVAAERWSRWRRSALLAVACTLLVASADEYHQSFLPSRTSSPIDVGIDLGGAIAAQLLVLGIILLFSRKPALTAVSA